MLGAAMGAAGEVNIYRLVHFHSLVQKLHHGDGMALGITGSILAVLVSRARHEAALEV